MDDHNTRLSCRRGTARRRLSISYVSHYNDSAKLQFFSPSAADMVKRGCHIIVQEIAFQRVCAMPNDFEDDSIPSELALFDRSRITSY